MLELEHTAFRRLVTRQSTPMNQHEPIFVGNRVCSTLFVALDRKVFPSTSKPLCRPRSKSISPHVKYSAPPVDKGGGARPRAIYDHEYKAMRATSMKQEMDTALHSPRGGFVLFVGGVVSLFFCPRARHCPFGEEAASLGMLSSPPSSLTQNIHLPPSTNHKKLANDAGRLKCCLGQIW
jgi:hypothetical protein